MSSSSLPERAVSKQTNTARCFLSCCALGSLPALLTLRAVCIKMSEKSCSTSATASAGRDFCAGEWHTESAGMSFSQCVFSSGALGSVFLTYYWEEEFVLKQLTWITGEVGREKGKMNKKGSANKNYRLELQTSNVCKIVIFNYEVGLLQNKKKLIAGCDFYYYLFRKLINLKH